jgi:hypothetical protein
MRIGSVFVRALGSLGSAALDGRGVSSPLLALPVHLESSPLVDALVLDAGHKLREGVVEV